ncbi:MAG: glycosyltransferase family 2 protein [Dehalococcoidia bacterium]|nr:glycosyltransferase family 2 protein [Dehalococcoidia bacterium]
MNDTPLVSVILNTYNRADLLPCSVESVLVQDYLNFEVIIVDDCSSDNTPEVVAHIVANHSDRVRSIRLEENVGLAGARNVGIRAARGPLIAFQDDDDIWLPEKLSAQVKALSRHPECGMCYGRALVATADGVRTARVFGGSGRGRTGDCFELMLRWHVILGPALMVRLPLLHEVGLFDETLRTAEDTDLFLRLTVEYSAVYLDQPLVLVREHGERKTRAEKSSGLRMRSYLSLYERLWDALPAARESLRGLVALPLAGSRLAVAEFENGGVLDRQAINSVVDAHPDWFSHPEACWPLALAYAACGSARDARAAAREAAKAPRSNWPKRLGMWLTYLWPRLGHSARSLLR